MDQLHLRDTYPNHSYKMSERCHKAIQATRHHPQPTSVGRGRGNSRMHANSRGRTRGNARSGKHPRKMSHSPPRQRARIWRFKLATDMKSTARDLDKMQYEGQSLVDFTYAYLARMRRRYQPLLPHHFNVEHYYGRLNSTSRPYIYYMADMDDPEDVIRAALSLGLGHPDTIKQESSSEESGEEDSTHLPSSSSPIRNPYSGEVVGRTPSSPKKRRSTAR